MLKISVIIPVIGEHDLTEKCIDHLFQHSINAPDFNILIIDNGSEVPVVEALAGPLALPNVFVLRNEENVGLYPALEQGYNYFKDTDIYFFTHNDLFVQELGWDNIIRRAYKNYPNLGVSGLVGAVGIGTDGGRIQTMCNFLGLELGAPYYEHGQLPPVEVVPACIMDGASLIIRKEALDEIKWDDLIEVHHFYDKILSLDILYAGWDNAVLRIGCDHAGGLTSCRPAYLEWAKKHIKEVYGEDVENGDKFIYEKSEQRLFGKYGDKFPVVVRPDWSRTDAKGVVPRNEERTNE